MTRILCAGIATLDQIFSLEAMPARPEKYRARDLVVTSGGTAANGAVAIARLGGEACLFGALGDDPRGDEIVAGLKAEGVDCAGVRRVPGRRSPLSAILVDSAGERIVVAHVDPALPGSTAHLPTRLPTGVDAVLGDTRWQAGSAHFFLPPAKPACRRSSMPIERQTKGRSCSILRLTPPLPRKACAT